MAEVRVYDIELVRTPASAPGARVHLYDIELIHVPPAPDGAQVYITDIFLTHGFETPRGPGAARVKIDGTWQPYTTKARWQGAWA